VRHDTGTDGMGLTARDMAQAATRRRYAPRDADQWPTHRAKARGRRQRRLKAVEQYREWAREQRGWNGG